MKIGIIGSGNIGATAARLFTRAGHEVAIANSRGPESLAGLVAELGPTATATTAEAAARTGDTVLVAVPFRAIDELPADAFAGKIVIDTNNYYPQRDGQVPALDDDSTTSSEMLAAALPGARVVKTFNSMRYQTWYEKGDLSKPHDERLAFYVAGDDPDAKAVAAGLIDELGFTPIDTGSLAEGGRRQQPGAPVYAADLTAARAREILG